MLVKEGFISPYAGEGTIGFETGKESKQGIGGDVVYNQVWRGEEVAFAVS